MRISFGKFHEIINEEVTKFLSEVDISDKELDHLLAMGRGEDVPKEKVVQVIGDNPEEATDVMFSLLGPDGIKDIMIALANAAGDEELLQYTRTMSEQAGVEAKEEAKKVISLPTFKISEKWGTPGTEDRKSLELFLGNIKGSSLQEKISNLENFVVGCEADCIASKDVPEILGNLVFLDVLASIIYDFNAKTAGFLWESLLAVLISGEQIAAEGGRNTPIEDLVDAEGGALSLKLVKDTSPYITGSWSGLKRALEKFGQITYIVVTKNSDEGMALSFYQFVITPENYGKWTEWASGTQWRIPWRRYKRNEYKIGQLSLGTRESLKNTAAQYAGRLGEGVTSIFNSLDTLTTHVNQYFAGVPDETKAGLEAKKDATILKQKVDQEF